MPRNVIQAEELLFLASVLSAIFVFGYLENPNPTPATVLPPPQGCEPLKSRPVGEEIWFCPPSTLVIREKEDSYGVPLPLQQGPLSGPDLSAPFAGGLYPQTKVSDVRWSTYSGSLPTNEERHGF